MVSSIWFLGAPGVFMKNRQVTKNSTFQLRLDSYWKKILFEVRGSTGRSMKDLVEEVLDEHYGPALELAKSIPVKGSMDPQKKK